MHTAGLMRAPSCGSVDLRPTLSSLSDGSGLRIFSVQSSSAAIPTSSPLAILSVGRTKDACPAHLSVGSASACANGAVRQGGANSPGAQQWVLEDAGKSATGAQLVYIYSAVGGTNSRIAVPPAGSGGACAPGCDERVTPNPLCACSCSCCATPLQARSGCAQRYLGADATNCNNGRVSLYSFADTRALIKWQVSRP